MPFTLSHAAASLPFRRLEPVWPALVMGTFAPDLQYFVQISDESRSGHVFPDLLTFTVPFALFVLWVFEWSMKDAVIELLPDGIQARLQNKRKPLAFTGWRQLLAIVVWMCIGIATHLAWDQFTHSYSWLATHLSLLQSPISLPGGSSILLAHLLQHVSTVLGFLILIAWFIAWYRRTTPATITKTFSPKVKLGLTASMTLAALIAGYFAAALRLANHSLPIRKEFYIVTVFEAVTLIFCLELLIFGLARSLGGRFRGLALPQAREGD